jgi:uncharacterized protein
MKADRVVIDTSILISAALSAPGKPAQVLGYVIEHAQLIFSRESFREIALTLLASKFDRYITNADRASLLTSLAASAEWTTISERVTVCRDPSDDMILETAISARANVIVTGDNDLLVLDPFRSIRIVSAAEFIATRQVPPPPSTPTASTP